tara:strand:+ start:7554 stop:8303 length:750 start_codon:yes stop_codon:yes gene_type:complete
MNLKLLKVSIALITIISATIMVLNPGWFFNNMPEENFSSLTMQKIAHINCEDCIAGTRELTLGHSSASGMVFSQDKDGKSYVLTAAHFCDYKDPFESAPSINSIINHFWVSGIDGASWHAEVIYTEENTDLCLMTTDMPVRHKVKFAKNMPVMGEKTFAMSAPLGISSPGMVLHFSGIFSGCDNYGSCFFTIPSTFGSSGSLILNKNNEVIGMIQMASPDFYSLSIGVGIKDIKDFIRKAEQDLGISIL